MSQEMHMPYEYAFRTSRMGAIQRGSQKKYENRLRKGSQKHEKEPNSCFLRAHAKRAPNQARAPGRHGTRGDEHSPPRTTRFLVT